MTEATGHHQVQCILSRSISRDAHWITCHDIVHCCCPVTRRKSTYEELLLGCFSSTLHPYVKQQLDKRDLWPSNEYYNKLMTLYRSPVPFHTVKIPLRCSSSSTTSTQSLRLAAINWAASITDIWSRTVSAWAGLSAETVPATFLVCRMRLVLPRFFDNSCSIFLRIAYASRFNKGCFCIGAISVPYLILFRLALSAWRGRNVGRRRDLQRAAGSGSFALCWYHRHEAPCRRKGKKVKEEEKRKTTKVGKSLLGLGCTM